MQGNIKRIVSATVAHVWKREESPWTVVKAGGIWDEPWWVGKEQGECDKERERRVTCRGRVPALELGVGGGVSTSLVAQTVKNLPVMWVTWVQSLGHEDPLDKEMATHSSILARKIPWTEDPGGLQSTGSQGVRHDWATNTKEGSKPEYKARHWCGCC